MIIILQFLQLFILKEPRERSIPYADKHWQGSVQVTGRRPIYMAALTHTSKNRVQPAWAHNNEGVGNVATAGLDGKEEEK